MKKLFIAFLMVFVSFSVSAADLPQVKYSSPSDKMPLNPAVRTGKFSNGLSYYILKNSKPEKRAYFQIVVRAGAIDEDKDQYGLAHFIEHMCFNGTKHFPKNDLVKYLESTGMKFGADLNANTTYDRTYYQLQVSTETSKTIEDGMQILQDWLHNVSFDPEEIEKERNVIMEEWRMGQGAGERIQKQQLPKMLYGSEYANRDVIGDTAIIKHAKRDVFLRFYNDWYRPNLSTVICVGDFDPAQVEQLIKKYFEGIKNPDKPREKKFYPIPGHDKPQISIAKDKEMPMTSVQVLFKKKARPEGTFANYRSGLVDNLVSTMLTLRYQELSRKAKPPFLYAAGGYENNFQIGYDLGAFALVSAPQSNDFTAGYKTMLGEAFRAVQTGFTQTELDRAKSTILKGYEKSYKEQDKQESEGLADELMRGFMYDEACPGIAYEYAFAKQEVPNITLDEVNQNIKSMVDGKNLFIGVAMPEKDGTTYPTEDELLKGYNDAATTTYEAYVDKTPTEPLLNKKPQAGRISGVKDIPEAGAKEYTLSNGVKVIVKKTNFKNDELQFSAFAKGGTSLSDDNSFRTAELSTDIVEANGINNIKMDDLTKILQDKQCSVSPFIGQYSQGMSGSTNLDDMETFFQLIYSYFTGARSDDESFTSFVAKQRESMINADKDPDAVFGDTLSAVLGSYNKRAMPMDVKDLDKIDQQKAIAFYNDRFSDAGNFTFVFVGNYDDAKFEKYIKTYIASLPSKSQHETWKDLGISKPTGKYTKIVKKGTADKATVMQILYDGYKYTSDNNYKINAMLELLNIKLLEQIREEIGGVYSIYAGPSMKKTPKEEYAIFIQYTCDPSREKEVMDAVDKVMDGIKKTPATAAEVKKIKEMQLKELEKNAEENSFWLSVISGSLQNEMPITTIDARKARIEKLTAKEIQEAAKTYLNMANYGRFVLNPEK